MVWDVVAHHKRTKGQMIGDGSPTDLQLFGGCDRTLVVRFATILVVH